MLTEKAECVRMAWFQIPSFFLRAEVLGFYTRLVGPIPDNRWILIDVVG